MSAAGTIRIGCAQLAYRGFDVAPGIRRVRDNVEYLAAFYAAREPVDLLLLGEFWLSSPNRAQEYRAVALSSGEMAGELALFARDSRTTVAANFVERSPNGILYDSTLVVSPSADCLLHYREIAAGIMPGSELATPVAGDSRPGGLAWWAKVVPSPFGRIGAAIGSDLGYPELFAALSLANADLVLHAAREPAWAGGSWQSLKPARCLDGGFFLASCNIADSRDSVGDWGESCGGSRIVDPSGAVIAVSSTSGEDYITAAISIDDATAARVGARHDRRVSQPWRELCAGIYRDH